MNTKIVVPILAGFGFLFLLAYVLRRRIAVLPLIYFGYAVPVLFWITTIISGQLHGNYHHLKNVISELGAVESSSEVFTSVSFVFLALLSTLFSIGFCKTSRRLNMSVVPAVLSFSKPVSMT